MNYILLPAQQRKQPRNHILDKIEQGFIDIPLCNCCLMRQVFPCHQHDLELCKGTSKECQLLRIRKELNLYVVMLLKTCHERGEGLRTREGKGEGK